MKYTNVYVESSFDDYYDTYLKPELPQFIYYRYPENVLKADEIGFKPLGQIDTETCYLYIDHKWQQVRTSNAKQLWLNHVAIADLGYTHNHIEVEIGKKVYKIIQNLGTGFEEFSISENGSNAHIIKVTKKLVGQNNEVIYKSEKGARLQFLSKYISALALSRDVEIAVQQHNCSADKQGLVAKAAYSILQRVQ